MLPHATTASLSRSLKSCKFDAFHFIGHGDVKQSGGVLVFEGRNMNESFADVQRRPQLSPSRCRNKTGVIFGM